jgi:alpha-glucosidase
MPGSRVSGGLPPGTRWWQRAAIYQVYPRSFSDHDGDGVGDLAGIEDRLPHLVGLGVDAVWISPIYPSPMADFGYDVSDHCDVDPMFGTLRDLDMLLASAHGHGIRVLLDLVPGHTSDQHPWFVASRSSRHDPKRNWYVWRDAAEDGGPPNNWVSEFGGPAWTWDEGSGQYYLSIYLPSQPALNWRHPEVPEAMFDVMRFWLDRGVDGFRIDAVGHLVPDAQLRDNPPDPDWAPAMGPARRLLRTYTAHRPEVLDFAREMRRLVDGYAGDRVLIGEAYGTLAQVIDYYGGPRLDGFQLPFNFQLIGAGWSPRSIAQLVEDYEAALPDGAWPNWVLGNHDRSRIASRVGPAQARVAAMLLLTLRGTPTIYQGDELGLMDTPIPADAVQDPWEKQVPGLGLGRDPVRTPIPWDDGPGRGFTEGRPWLPIDQQVASVAAQAEDPDSMLGLYRRLLALRRAEPALAVGTYRTLAVDDALYVFEREHEGRRVAVALNLTDRSQTLPVDGATLLSTTSPHPDTSTQLAPNEGRIVALSEPCGTPIAGAAT